MLRRISVLVGLVALLAACGVPDADPPRAATDPTPVPESYPAPSESVVVNPAPVTPTATVAPTTVPVTTTTTIDPTVQPFSLITNPAAWTDVTIQSTVVLSATRESLTPLAWSPDGTRLLYQSGTSGIDLSVYDRATQTAQRIVERARVAAWSPDGQQIAYLPYRWETTPQPDRWLLSYDLATKRSVTIGDLSQRDLTGAELTWTTTQGLVLATISEILAFPTPRTPGPPVTLLRVPPALAAAGPATISRSPDGRHTIVTTGAPNQQSLSFLDNGTVLTTVALGDAGFKIWTPDGQRVMVGHDAEFMRLYSAQGELLATSTPDTLKLFPLDWSPDSHTLLYATNHGGTGQFDAYFLDPQRSGTLRLPVPFESTDGIYYATWSPTGQHIAYTIDDYTGDGSQPKRASTYLLIATISRP